jgi:hypothetical protein
MFTINNMPKKAVAPIRIATPEEFYAYKNREITTENNSSDEQKSLKKQA